jgi:hypothetical protein
MDLNFYSKFEKSDIFKAVTLDQNPIFKWRKFEKKFFLILFSFSLILFFLKNSFPLLGISLFSFDFFIISLLKDLFFEQKIKNPTKKGEIFDKIDFEIAKAIYNALKSSKTQKTNSSIFLYFLLDEKNPKIRFIFSRLFIPLSELKNRLFEDKREEEEIESLISELSENKEKIKLGEILFVLSQKNKIFKDFLIQYEVKPEDLKEVANWIDYLESEFLESKKFWKWEN